MRFEVSPEVFVDAVAWVAQHLPAAPSQPALAGILVEATMDSQVVVRAYDYEMAGTATLPADGVEPGQVLVSGQLLTIAVKALPSQTIRLELPDGDTRVRLSAGTSEFELPILHAEDYPRLPHADDVLGTVDGLAFATKVGQVAIARPHAERAALAEVRPSLAGMLVTFDGDVMRLAATDTTRIAVAELPWRPRTADSIGPMVAPIGAMTGIAKASARAELVGLKSSTLTRAPGSSEESPDDEEQREQTLFGLATDGRQVDTRLIGDEFPNMERAFSRVKPVALAQLPIPDVVEALKRTTLVQEHWQAAKLDFGPDEVTVSGGNAEWGTAAKATIAIKYSGGPMTVHVNPKFLKDGLQALHDAELAYLHLTTANIPLLVTALPLDDPELDYKYLIMPIHPKRVARQEKARRRP